MSSLEKCVERLQEYNARGELAKYEFNGHWLYSDTVTMDSAYLEVTGMNKADFDKAQEELIETIRKERRLAEKTAQNNIPNWIERGHKLFSENKWSEWDKIVPIRANDLYYGMELDNVLQVQEILTSGFDIKNFAKARECMEEQGHSGTSWFLVCALIEKFCTNGDVFVMWMDKVEKLEKEESPNDNLDCSIDESNLCQSKAKEIIKNVKNNIR